jgi:hypothetical protein
MLNGHGSFAPTALDRVRRIVSSFPDARSLSALRTLGVRTVVVHPKLADGTRWEKALRRPIRGLGIEKRIDDGVVLFDLDSRRALRSTAVASRGEFILGASVLLQ